jgi:hypothetical protein
MEMSPVELVQNPAFGAQLLWRFAKAYQDETPERLANLEVMFLVLPLVLHAGSLGYITSTFPMSGLGKMVEKLGNNRENLLAVHDRALLMRTLTLQSIGIGITSGLLHLNYDTALVRANAASQPRIVERVKNHLAGAHKLGVWFSHVPTPQVFSILQVQP